MALGSALQNTRGVNPLLAVGPMGRIRDTGVPASITYTATFLSYFSWEKKPVYRSVPEF